MSMYHELGPGPEAHETMAGSLAVDVVQRTTLTVTVDHDPSMSGAEVASLLAWALVVARDPESTQIDQVADALEKCTIVFEA